MAAVLFRTSGLGPVAVTFWRFAIAIAAAAYALLRPLRRSSAPVPEKEQSWRSAALTGGGMAVSQVAPGRGRGSDRSAGAGHRAAHASGRPGARDTH